MSGQPPDNDLVVRGRRTRWSALPDAAMPSPAAVVVRTAEQGLAAVRRHARSGTELLVVAAGRVDDALSEDLRADGFHVVDGSTVQAPTSPREPAPGQLWLLTSGTTGRPKRIGHTLASLTTVSAPQAPRTWLCPYSAGTYAWWQIVTLGLTSTGQDLVLLDPEELDSWPSIAARHGVTAVSGTPTFWRQALFSDPRGVAAIPLEQVTLGGEPVDQAVLDRLHQVHPGARVSWIYASSEVGAAIVVHDGRAGFPVELLDRPIPGRPLLQVVDDELVITSPHHGDGIEGPLRTGDRVRVADGRVVIVGRSGSDEINVGGSKVSAGAVRDVLLAHPGVAWAQVRGRRAPVVGQMVVADVVPAPAPEPVDDATLRAWCEARLPDYGVPRRIRFLPEIPAKETLKSDV